MLLPNFNGIFTLQTIERLFILGLENYHESGIKNYHPEALVRPSCSLKAGCVEFGTGRYKWCGAESGESGCLRLHSCCDVRTI